MPLHCGYCHNPELIDPRTEAPLDWADIRAFLQQRRGLLDAVVFSGGEPTLQADLAETLAEVRALGFKVGLHTAGPYPRRLAELLPRLDWIALDIKALPADYPAITGVLGSGEAAWESLRLVLGSGVAHEIRTTVPPDWSADRLAAVARGLAEAGVRHYAVQACTWRPGAPPPPSIQTLAAAIDARPFHQLLLRGR